MSGEPPRHLSRTREQHVDVTVHDVKREQLARLASSEERASDETTLSCFSRYHPVVLEPHHDVPGEGTVDARGIRAATRRGAARATDLVGGDLGPPERGRRGFGPNELSWRNCGGLVRDLGLGAVAAHVNSHGYPCGRRSGAPSCAKSAAWAPNWGRNPDRTSAVGPTEAARSASSVYSPATGNAVSSIA